VVSTAIHALPTQIAPPSARLHMSHLAATS